MRTSDGLDYVLKDIITHDIVPSAGDAVTEV